MGLDPGYQGHFEKLYTDAFVQSIGGGYADAVATGSAAVFIALRALSLPKGSEVLLSPITDPGTVAAIIMNDLKPRLVDSMPGNYNIGPDQLAARIGPNCTALVVVHNAGQACPIQAIVELAHKHGIKVLEDCSQAHGARHAGKPVGRFGDIAAFSAMYRKAHIAGPSGGLVYSRDLELFRLALAHADRGKPRWLSDFDDRNPNTFLFPALNFHTDEISCAIGLASLGRLAETMVRRLAFVVDLAGRLAEDSELCEGYPYTPGDSPFFYPVVVDTDRISCSKVEFAKAVEAEGIGLSPHYQYVVADWPFVQPYLADKFETRNARSIVERSFNLYVNENYGQPELEDTIEAILKVERHYRR
jgi:dTDP-4-amino-4,6-dideoxygalactose transaminase